MNKYQGVLKDKRSTKLKNKDYKHDEIAYGLSPIEWIVKKPEVWKKWSVRNQLTSSSCIFQGIAKAVETVVSHIESARYYRFRQNYPEAGAWLYDGAEILRKQGIELESNQPSQGMTEVEMNKDVVKTLPNILDEYDINYFFVNPKNIDDVATVVQNYGHCVLTFESNYDEWKDVPEVKGFVKWGHCVCATDYTIFDSSKALVIDESWGVGVTQFNAQRVIKEGFLKKRCTGAVYFILTKKEEIKPSHRFVFPLKKGSVGKEVLALQEILVYEKCLDLIWLKDSQKYGGIFGRRTFDAVVKLQEKYKEEILTPLGLHKGTGYVGGMTLAFLNNKYGN